VQEIVSHAVSSHLEVHQQGMDGAAQAMIRLQAAYDAWRHALVMTQP